MAKNQTIKTTFPVLDMGCASCAAKVEKALGNCEGVASATVNYAAATVTVEYCPSRVSPELLHEAAQKAGYGLLTGLREDVADEAEQAHAAKYRTLKRRAVWAMILSAPVFAIGMAFMNLPHANEMMCILSTPVVFWLGRGFFVDAWRQLKRLTANMNTLVALSTGIAYCFSLFNMLFPQFWHSRGVHPLEKNQPVYYHQFG